MSRIVVIGLPGSGKSTFSDKLGKQLKIPVHHLDKHMFIPGDKKRDRQEFLEIKKALVAEESWIIEGCSLSTLEMRFARADTVIYFHLPRFLCIWRMLKRYCFPDQSLIDKAEGCSQVFNWELVNYTWNFDRNKREHIEDLRKKYPHVEFLVFRHSKDAQNYLDKYWKH